MKKSRSSKLKGSTSMNTKNRGLIKAGPFFERLLGPMTVGMLIRGYRVSNDMTLQDLAMKLDVTLGFVSNFETGKKRLSLAKTLEIAEQLGEFKEVYAQIWMEEQLRDAGLEFHVTLSKKAG